MSNASQAEVHVHVMSAEEAVLAIHEARDAYQARWTEEALSQLADESFKAQIAQTRRELLSQSHAGELLADILRQNPGRLTHAVEDPLGGQHLVDLSPYLDRDPDETYLIFNFRWAGAPPPGRWIAPAVTPAAEREATKIANEAVAFVASRVARLSALPRGDGDAAAASRLLGRAVMVDENSGVVLRLLHLLSEVEPPRAVERTSPEDLWRAATAEAEVIRGHLNSLAEGCSDVLLHEIRRHLSDAGTDGAGKPLRDVAAGVFNDWGAVGMRYNQDYGMSGDV
jgi:hypothetical protein